MPSLSEHPSRGIVKLLNIGESGAGKSGALASLALAGYRLHILDYDNGVDILANILRNDPKALANVRYETLRDEVVFQKGVPRIKPPPRAFARAGEVLEEWNAGSFNSHDVLCLDTLATFSQTSFNHWLYINQRLNQRPQLTDFGAMADSVLLFIDTITSLECNVVVNTHIRYFEGDEDTQTTARGLPNAKGQQIPNNVGKFFNTTILTRTVGSGPGIRRVISTKPQGVVEVKTSNPSGVKDQYPLETGLAQLFRDILGTSPGESPPPQHGERFPSPPVEAREEA